MIHAFSKPAGTALAAALAVAGTLSLAAPAAALPTYATPSADQTIRGTIASVVGKYDIRVRDERGYIDHVRLHDGTVITPTGLTLAPGQSVTVVGRTAGSAFAANEIDTPYVAEYQRVASPYLYPGYGYGAFGPYDVGFGPAFYGGYYPSQVIRTYVPVAEARRGETGH